MLDRFGHSWSELQKNSKFRNVDLGLCAAWRDDSRSSHENDGLSPLYLHHVDALGTDAPPKLADLIRHRVTTLVGSQGR
jgi:hypothetical protein